ncbi:4384_t:CDS:2 [Cetraspora pellucida]|uniref:4384_t:CDS:1 n=1 Tax=Cetraspora pellucida TaxID=1433469 RepID=A0A9N9N6L5_9GLOM|nr:4384_t:CDS:2 [Cetraspora pellucida]
MLSKSNNKIIQTSIPHISLSQDIELQKITMINLTTLEHSLPLNYHYIVDSFEPFQALNFLGAFSNPFEAKLHVNICTVDNTTKWLDEFFNLHKTTMWETQGRIIKGVKYLLSKRFHCHVTSFRPISNETKELKYDNDEAILADRAICPHKHNVYYLHQKYLDTFIGT